MSLRQAILVDRNRDRGGAQSTRLGAEDVKRTHGG